MYTTSKEFNFVSSRMVNVGQHHISIVVVVMEKVVVVAIIFVILV